MNSGKEWKELRFLRGPPCVSLLHKRALARMPVVWIVAQTDHVPDGTDCCSSSHRCKYSLHESVTHITYHCRWCELCCDAQIRPKSNIPIALYIDVNSLNLIARFLSLVYCLLFRPYSSALFNGSTKRFISSSTRARWTVIFLHESPCF